MRRTAIRRGFRSFPSVFIAAGILWAHSLCGEARSAEPTKAAVSATAEQLVADARQAKLDGDTTRYFSLLRKAIQIAPDYQLARWQLGQLKIDGEWVAVEEAQRRAAANPKQAQYAELRKQHGETPEGQLALARWCRKNDLDEEARFHWASVLSIDPNNEEALRAVDMRWHDGRLLTREQIAQQKERLQQLKQSEKRWKPTIAKWRRAIAGGDPAERQAALDEIRALTAIDTIVALEKFTLWSEIDEKRTADDCRDVSLALIGSLEKIADQSATESLVRHAVFSAIPDVRTSAIEKLKPRSQHEYVPLLLSGLAMPIESSFDVRTDAGGSVHYTHSLYREGAESDWEVDLRRSAMQHQLDNRMYRLDIHTNRVNVGPPRESHIVVAARKGAIAARSENRFGNVAAATEYQVERLNQFAEAFNSLVISVLVGTTGKNLGESPKAWWEWWRTENENYASDEHPVERYYDSDKENYYHGSPAYQYVNSGPAPPPPPIPPPRRGPYSCFAKGTPVWTKTGQRQIETLDLGDLVLAQNVDTGELSYKPVIAKTVRPPSEILKLSLEGGELRTTLGHPFWVAGAGWRMAKELEEGAVLHGVTGAPRVKSIEKSGQEEAYNLVVAEFNTYFVGESGVLVHDNTPRTPTRAALPGVQK